MSTLHAVRQESRELKDFDLTPEAVKRIVQEAHLAVLNLNEHFPSNARGLTFYFYVVAGLRHVLLSAGSGWKKECVDGLEFVTHSAKGIRIGYTGGDESTGIQGSTPKSRTRGSASIVAAKLNMQLQLDYPAHFFDRQANKAVGVESWFLVIFNGGTGYRLELALPITVKGKRFVRWAHRILLGEVSINSEPKLDEAATPASAAKPALRRRTKKGPSGENARAANQSNGK